MSSVKSKDGTGIAFFRSGHGAPLVLVHGTSADHTRWAPILPKLEERFTVYAVDRRGRGASGDAAEYSIEREFDDVAAVIDSLGEPAFVLGHSYGALCSLEASLRTPNIRQLVLYEPPIPTGVSIVPPGLVDRLQSLLDRGEPEQVVTTFFQEVVHMPPAELKMLQSLPNWPARVAAAKTLPRELRADDTYRFEPARFATMHTPTLLLLGGDSPPFFKKGVETVQAALPASRVAVMPGQQHAAMNTAPELFLRLVSEFLKD
ncbi:MAG TPA: alpha/beta hydrolase [Polyangiaceae bacterium]|nr:alpha/beta hydrolase [Polyangiaceae bacterium]